MRRPWAGEMPDALPALTSGDLAPVVRAALGDRARLVDWTIDPIRYDRKSPISGGVFRVAGRVSVGRRGEPERSWCAVLKVLRRTSETNRRGFGWWLREPEAYDVGPLPRGELAAPRLLAIQAPAEGLRWLWTAYASGKPAAQWTADELGTAAGRLGSFQRQFVEPSSIPAFDSWCVRFVDSGAPEARAALLSDALGSWSELRRTGLFADSFVDIARSTLARVSSWVEFLRATRQTVSHGDFGVQNLVQEGDGARRTIALDWAHLNIGPIAEDLSIMLGTATRGLFGTIDPARLDALEAIALSVYSAEFRGITTYDEIDFAYRFSSAVHFGLALGELARDLIRAGSGSGTRADPDDRRLRDRITFMTRALSRALDVG